MTTRRLVPILLTAVFLFLLFAPSARAVLEISDGSVKALYHLHDTTDSSGNGYTLTNNGTTTFPSAKLGNGADFGTANSTKYLSVANDLGYTGGNVSVSLWWNPSTITNDGSEHGIFELGDAGNHVYTLLEYYKLDGTFHFLSDRGKPGVGVNRIDVTTSSVSTGTWHHLMVIYDGTTQKLYLNNSEIGSVGASGNGSSGSGDLFTVGRNSLNGTFWGDELIDEAVVFNRALSADERAALYNNGSGTTVCATAGCASSSTPYIVSSTQLKADGTTEIAEGGTTDEATVKFKALLNSSTSNQLQLWVQVSTSTAFSNVRLATSSLVSTSTYATTTITNLSDDSYYWRMKVLDTGSNVSSTWTQFGTVDSLDFVVNAVHERVEVSDGSVRALYHLENTSDSSDNGYTLTNNGGTGFPAGKLGSGAADFGTSNSSKYLTVANDLSINFGNPFSVSLWFNPNTLTNDGSEHGIFELGDEGNHVAQLLEYYKSGGTTYFLSDRLKPGSGVNRINVAYALSTGTWYHIMVIYDGSTVRLYLNNVEIGSVGASGNGGSGSADVFTVGRNSLNGTFWGEGLIDEAVVFSKALSAGERAALYDGGLGAEVCVYSGCASIGLSSSSQKTSGGTPLGIGEAATLTDTVILGARLNSSSSNSLQLEVEVRPSGVPFLNTANATSSFVSSTQFASTTFTGANSGYHWQARAKDTNGAVSAWQNYGPVNATNTFLISVGKSAYFDGGSSWAWSANASTSFTATSSFTVEFWYRTSVTSTVETFIDTRSTTTGKGLWVSKDADQGIHFLMNCATDSIEFHGAVAGANATEVSGFNPNGTWHHVAVTKSSATTTNNAFHLYFDGEDVSASGTTQSDGPVEGVCFDAPASGNYIWLGETASGTPYYLTGNMDAVRIWETERSSSSIADYWDQEISAATSGLVALWNFNGTTTEAISGSQPSGLSGAASFASSTPFGHFVQTYRGYNVAVTSTKAMKIYGFDTIAATSSLRGGMQTWNNYGVTVGGVVISTTTSLNAATLNAMDAANAEEVGWAAQYNVSSGTLPLLQFNNYAMSATSGFPVLYKQGVVTHELGHALGLDHSYWQNIMFYAVPTSTAAVLGEQDKKDYDFLWKNE